MTRPEHRRRLSLSAVLLMTLAVSGCASSGAVPRPFPGATSPGARPSPVAPESSAVASGIVATALALAGTQYRNGGSEPTRGFDCSGLVQWVFAQHGTSLPRETREQYAIGRKIDEDDVRPGDLVFFETVGEGPSHVGIALGGGDFVHAPSTRGIVRVESYKKIEYWSERWLGARRVALTGASQLGGSQRPALAETHLGLQGPERSEAPQHERVVGQLGDPVHPQ